MYYTDPYEATWLNEGLSDFAQTLTGYVDATATVFDRGADSHIYCFQGFGTVQTPFNPNPRDCGGPENSLTLWGEGGNPQRDPGRLRQRLLVHAVPVRPLRRGHHVQAAPATVTCRAWPAWMQQLKAEGVHDMYRVLHDFQSMTLLDKIVGDPARLVLGVPKRG